MFRNYDPAIGRFTAIDPLATMYGSYSGYHYGLNNPAMMNDPSGATSCTCSGPPGNLWLPDFFNPADYWAHMAWINSDAYATMQFYTQFYTQHGFNSGGSYQNVNLYTGALNNAPDAWNIMNNWVNGVPNSIETGVSSSVPVNAWQEYTLEPYGTEVYVNGKLQSRTVDGYTKEYKRGGGCTKCPDPPNQGGLQYNEGLDHTLSTTGAVVGTFESGASIGTVQSLRKLPFSTIKSGIKMTKGLGAAGGILTLAVAVKVAGKLNRL